MFWHELIYLTHWHDYHILFIRIAYVCMCSIYNRVRSIGFGSPIWVLSSTLGSWIRHFAHVPVSNTCLIWVCIEYRYKHVTYLLHIRGQTNNFFYSRYGRDTTGTYRIVPPHFFLSLSVSLFFAFHPVIPPHFFLAFLSLGLSVLCVSSSRHSSLFLLLLLLLLCC